MQWVPGNLGTVIMIGTFRTAPRLSGLCLLAHLNASPTSNQHQSQTSVSSECFMNLSTFAPLHPSTPGPSHRPLSLEPPTHTLTSSLSFLPLSLFSTQQPNWSYSSPLTSCHGPHLTQNKTQLLSMTLTSRDLNDLTPHHHSDSIPCHSLHSLLVPKHTGSPQDLCICFLSLEHSSSRCMLLATSTPSVLLKDHIFSETVPGHSILTDCPLLTYNPPALPHFVSTAPTTPLA